MGKDLWQFTFTRLDVKFVIYLQDYDLAIYAEKDNLRNYDWSSVKYLLELCFDRNYYNFNPYNVFLEEKHEEM